MYEYDLREASMYEYDLREVEELTGLTREERDHAMRWLAKQPEPVRMEAVKLGLDKVKKLAGERKVREKATEVLYAMLVRAARDMWWVEQAKALKRKGKVDEETARRILEIRAARIKAGRKRKSAKKYRRIKLELYWRIKQLLEQGLSWRQIAEYLAKYHKLRISHSYLREAFLRASKELESTPPTQGA